jgi:glycosyltransferase involved in cell wall biosynthesis
MMPPSRACRKATMTTTNAPRPVRVAQVVTRFIAGAGGMALRGALALDPTRFEVDIIAGEGGDLLSEAEAAGLRVVRVRSLVPQIAPSADVAAYRELVRHLRAGCYDIVHTHSAKAGTLGRLAARKAGVPAVVHTFHGFPFHDFQSGARRAAYIGIERRLGRLTDEFLAVGNAVAAEAVRLEIAPPERIRATVCTVAAGIPRATPALRIEARKGLGLPHGAPVVGTVGRLDRQKAPLDFVSAASLVAVEHPEARFVWVGDGPLRDKVRAALVTLGLAGRFLLTGERKDVPDLLPAFDVFAMASLYEGQPCALVEAMTCGIPAVATAVNAVPEVVIAGVTGLLVPPRRPRVLAGAITWLIDNPGEASAFAAEAQARTGRRFEPAELAIELESTYRRALGENPLTPRRSPLLPARRHAPSASPMAC